MALIEMKEERIIIISEVDIFKARRIGREMASSLGFDEVETGKIEIALSELATNLIKHRTINGEIVLRPINDYRRIGMEIRAEDKGPGIKDLELALKGGFSTRGTLGIGLSGVKRLMDDFSVESKIGKGTLVTARKWLKNKFNPKINFSVIGRPLPGEEVSGDAYFIKQDPFFAVFSVVDALGHGREAYETGLLALQILEDNHKEAVTKIIERCHHGLRHTRGVAIALCKVDFLNKKFEHIGIGNVETRIYGTAEPIRPFCYNGTLGMRMEAYRVMEYPYIEGSTIVVFSDGISGRFDLSPQLLSETPQEIARYVFDKFVRDNDDATVLIGR